MELFTWDILTTGAGAAVAVGVIVELTKGLPGIRRIPTQIWSYVLAVAIMLAAQLFSRGWVAAEAAMVLLNGAVVSLCANGGYDLVTNLKNRIGGEKNV